MTTYPWPLGPAEPDDTLRVHEAAHAARIRIEWRAACTELEDLLANGVRAMSGDDPRCYNVALAEQCDRVAHLSRVVQPPHTWDCACDCQVNDMVQP